MLVVRCFHTPFFPNLAGGMVLWYRGTIPGRLPPRRNRKPSSCTSLAPPPPPQNQCAPAMAATSCSVRLWMCVRGACMVSMVPPCTNCEVVRPGLQETGACSFSNRRWPAALEALTHCGDARHPGALAACGRSTTVLMVPLTVFLGTVLPVWLRGSRASRLRQLETLDKTLRYVRNIYGSDKVFRLAAYSTRLAGA